VLVIGAGILGVSSAYHMKRNSPDKNVLLIDRLGDAGQANTGRSNAMFRNTFGSIDNVRLSNASIDYYLHVQHELGIDVGVDSIGYLWLMTEGQFAQAGPSLEKMKASNVELRTYDRTELQRMMPGFVSGPSSAEAGVMSLGEVSSGVLGVKCGRLAPDRLAGYYRDQFTALGGRVMFNTEANKLVLSAREQTGIDGEPFVWQDWKTTGARLADGTEVSAETVVVAAGAWNNDLLDPIGIDGHSKAKKRQIFTISVSGKPDLERLLHTPGFNDSGVLPFVILPKSGVMIKAVRESAEFWIGCEDEINRPYITYPEHDLDLVSAEPSYYEQNIYPILREYLPRFEGERPSRMWAGYYGYNTLDNMPYVFAENGLIVVGGDSGSGVMKADSLGRIVDAVYRGGEGADAELYDGTFFKASKIGFRSRDVERETWLL
jgi:glycine/D-amino acid oxidase-like deaminating enzyme